LKKADPQALDQRRHYLRERYKGRDYPLCPLCGTPIRSIIYVDPSTDRIMSDEAASKDVVKIAYKLTRMCEVCFQEGGEIEHQVHLRRQDFL